MGAVRKRTGTSPVGVLRIANSQYANVPDPRRPRCFAVANSSVRKRTTLSVGSARWGRYDYVLRFYVVRDAVGAVRKRTGTSLSEVLRRREFAVRKRTGTSLSEGARSRIRGTHTYGNFAVRGGAVAHSRYANVARQGAGSGGVGAVRMRTAGLCRGAAGGRGTDALRMRTAVDRGRALRRRRLGLLRCAR